jgi:hypothetical protein
VRPRGKRGGGGARAASEGKSKGMGGEKGAAMIVPILNPAHGGGGWVGQVTPHDWRGPRGGWWCPAPTGGQCPRPAAARDRWGRDVRRSHATAGLNRVGRGADGWAPATMEGNIG